MPEKPLPHQLVEDLIQASPEIRRLFAGMKNVDHAKDWKQVTSLPASDSTSKGRRVRELNVAKKYPGVQVVIKRIETHTPQEVIDALKQRVKMHNQLNVIQKLKRLFHLEKPIYLLKEPIAYDIGNGLVAMHRTNSPSIEEILGPHNNTERGAEALAQLQKERAFTIQKLDQAGKTISRETGITPPKLMVTGFENGMLILTPFINMPETRG